MKKILHLSTLLLLSWCLSLTGMQQAWASHAQAGQLTYSYVSTAANGDQTYLVTVNFFRDCSGIAAPASFALTATNSCSATGRSATLNPVGQPVIGTPYCASVQSLAICPLGQGAPPSAPANFATYTYQNTIVLPPAAEWILSVEEGSRPLVANISAGTLRLEARLYSRITPVGGAPIVITNNSPVFSTTNLPVPFVYVNQESTISFSASDSNGDSLVYSLDRPLNGCNTYETYSPYPGAGCITRIDPRCNSRIINCASAPGFYTQNLPISVANDTIYENGLTVRPPCPTGTIVNATVRPRFSFNASQASFTFTPNLYVNTPSSQGDNKYAVVGKVTEYRRINGRSYIVGTARRDFLVIVIDGTGNTVPSNPTGSAGPPRSGVVLNITRDTTDLEIKTCNYSRVRFNFTDPDNLKTPAPSPLQNLTVNYPADINTNLLQGGDIGTFVLSRDGTPTPTATFYFQPISSLAGTTILIPLRIEDDGCPAKGIQYRTIRIRIVSFRGAEAQASVTAPGLGNSTIPTICPGGSLTINGGVNRPDSVRVATTGAVILQTYSYQWVALNRTPAQAGLPTLTNTQNITVRPTVSTRYRLFISPNQGFGVGLCGDTTSVLVRVAPEPIAAITLADPLTSSVCGGAQVTLRGSVSRTDQLTDSYTYRWTNSAGATIATTQNTTITAPTAPGTYTYQLTVQGLTQYGCDNTTSIQIQVVPPPVVSITRTLAQVCAGAPVTLTATTTRPAGSGSNLADTYTYLWSGPGVPANSTGATLIVTPTTVGRNTYTVSVTGASRYNCSATQTVQVEVVPQPTLVATTDNAFVCPGGTANLRATATAPNGFSDNYTYTWTGGGLPAGTTGATLAVRPTANTTYTVTATGNAQTGCVNTATVQVQVPPALQADFVTADSVGTNGQRTSRPPVRFTFTNRTAISAQPQGATFTYRWTYQRIKDITGAPVSETETVFDGPTLPAGTTPAPLELKVAGIYRIRLTATATVGGAACAPAVKERLVVVPDLQVPNIITPNGDGLNDVFKVSTANTLSKMEIYNRWGRKVYEQSNYANNWGGDNQPAGVYYYLLTDRNGAQTKGWIEIVR
jgi:gliding motility-associated-like protein